MSHKNESPCFSDQEYYNFAKDAFEQQEGRMPDMNNTKDADAIAILEVGIRYGVKIKK